MSAHAWRGEHLADRVNAWLRRGGGRRGEPLAPRAVPPERLRDILVRNVPTRGFELADAQLSSTLGHHNWRLPTVGLKGSARLEEIKRAQHLRPPTGHIPELHEPRVCVQCPRCWAPPQLHGKQPAENRFPLPAAEGRHCRAMRHAHQLVHARRHVAGAGQHVERYHHAEVWAAKRAHLAERRRRDHCFRAGHEQHHIRGGPDTVNV
mmetsp:Transcript_109616/g.309202  ORF Transcript_109616/g.309202 Transcript_109616/m.309202 type:complete len:207 (+) Transcript_109616:795-1415(+)